MNAWHFQELLSKNEVELQVCKLDWGCTSDEEAWVGLRWWIGSWKNVFFVNGACHPSSWFFFGSEKQSRIGNWLNMARMLTVEIQNFLFFHLKSWFSVFCEVWGRFFEAILKDFGKFDLIVGSDIILSSFDARMCLFIVPRMFISGYIPKGSAVQTKSLLCFFAQNRQG